jgi:hypothetical protein
MFDFHINIIGSWSQNYLFGENIHLISPSLRNYSESITILTWNDEVHHTHLSPVMNNFNCTGAHRKSLYNKQAADEQARMNDSPPLSSRLHLNTYVRGRVGCPIGSRFQSSEQSTWCWSVSSFHFQPTNWTLVGVRSQQQRPSTSFRLRSLQSTSLRCWPFSLYNQARGTACLTHLPNFDLGPCLLRPDPSFAFFFVFFLLYSVSQACLPNFAIGWHLYSPPSLSATNAQCTYFAQYVHSFILVRHT